MKRFFLLLFSISVFMLLFTSCEREMMSYDGPESVYFAVQGGNSWGSLSNWPYVPFTNVEFVKTTKSELPVSIVVRTTGPSKDFPRIVDFQIVGDSTTAVQGVDYEIPDNVVIEAGSTETIIPLLIRKSQKMKTDTVKIQLKLVQNEYFSLIFKSWDNPKELTSGTIYEGFDASRHNIICTDILVKPANWIGSADATTNKEKSAFGVFSAKKFNLINEVMGYTYTDFMSSETMTIGVQYAISRYMSNYLVGKYKQHQPVLEDDGRLMYFEYCPWSSFVGVPWDGVYVEY